MPKQVTRGEMYYATLSPTLGSEQDGFRPVLIIQANSGSRNSPTVIVAPITSSPKKPYLPTHYTLPVGNGIAVESQVLLEQVRTIDKCRLYHYIGHLDELTMRRINRALGVTIGLDVDIECSCKDDEDEDDEMVITLCATCVKQFYEVDDCIVRRTDPHQRIKEVCDFCGQRRGFYFSI